MNDDVSDDVMALNGAQLEWDGTTWRRFTLTGSPEWAGNHCGMFAHIFGPQAELMDEVFKLRAQLAGVRETLEGIALADWRGWDDGLNTADSFVSWAKNRARHTLAALEAS